MVRTFFFKLCFFIGIILICIFFTLGLILPRKVVIFGGKIAGYWAYICLKIFASTNIEIRGLENLERNNKFFIACTHQSIFETFYLQTIFNSPYFILKKELIKIPLFGLFLKKIGCISVQRNKISKHNLNFFSQVKQSIESTERPLIIFPQGRRFKTNERPEFKKGVSRIYELNISCQPVVMNSGDVWPKVGKINFNKKLIISILKPIRPGIYKENFKENLQELMYDELERIT
tara:strand:+ start:334 stop:1032 length:699 start_codon:yes stop_codon:yes gene_type:complete